jgi:Right handed beta helix region
MANNGQTFTNYRISTTSGDCVDLSGASDVTFQNSNIGPCGGRGIYISGGSGNNIFDSYIHVEGASRSCCDTRDGILVNGGNSTTIQGNVVAYSESNIEVFADNTVIVGNFLLNPQGVYPRGQQIQTGAGTNVRIANNLLVSTRDATLGPAIGTASNAPILMSQGATSNPPEDSINIYTTQYADIENNFVTGGLDATTPGSGGAQSPSGCGILGADSDNVTGANHTTVKNNIVVNTGQCGIGIGTGTNQTVVGNKVLNLNPNTGGNTAIYIWNQYAPACGPVLLNGNVATELLASGSASGYWNGGGCAPVTCDGVNTTIDSCNIFDYGGNRTAYDALKVDPAVLTPPLIPPLPNHCTVNSPYSTQTSLTPCI